MNKKIIGKSVECPKCGNAFRLNQAVTCQCAQCGARWIPRKADPVQCPRCKRVDWRPEPKGGDHADA